MEEKAYLYHRVPADMQGTVLYPLNTLKGIYPELYMLNLEKYSNRKHIMEQFIPTLKCLWNDVLHFTAVKPMDLKQALVEAGMAEKQMSFFQIDPHLLQPEQTTVYLNQSQEKEHNLTPEEFREYNPEELVEYSTLSLSTKNYYTKMYSLGKNPLLFLRVPHILYKATIDISQAQILTV